MQQKHPGLPPWYHHILPKQLTFRANDSNKAELLPLGKFIKFSTRKLVYWLVKKKKKLMSIYFRDSQTLSDFAFLPKQRENRGK